MTMWPRLDDLGVPNGTLLRQACLMCDVVTSPLHNSLHVSEMLSTALATQDVLSACLGAPVHGGD